MVALCFSLCLPYVCLMFACELSVFWTLLQVGLEVFEYRQNAPIDVPEPYWYKQKLSNFPKPCTSLFFRYRKSLEQTGKVAGNHRITYWNNYDYLLVLYGGRVFK